MKFYSQILALATVCFAGFLAACSGARTDIDEWPGSPDGGAGGSETTGDAGSSSGGIDCVVDQDCPPAETACYVGKCYDGSCVVVPAPVGTQCNDGTYTVCDGNGSCGDLMPPDATACYAPKPMFARCPTCDDGDPATKDECRLVALLLRCYHEPLPDGAPCGPTYTVQHGACCPSGLQ